MEKRKVSKLLSKIWETCVEKTIVVCGGVTILIVLSIFAYLLWDAHPAFSPFSLQEALHLPHSARDFNPIPLNEMLLGREWDVNIDMYGMFPLILGSLLVTAGAIVVGVPIGVCAAIYIGEIASPRIREILKPTIETLAAIPSVVIGFIGLVLLAPALVKLFEILHSVVPAPANVHLVMNTGLTALTGSLMLAFMAMPTIISISEDALHAVPQQYRTASMAMGATKWQTIRRVIVPAARSGILAAIMLGVGRAIGETMTVLMVTGNSPVIPHTLLQPVRTLTATIAAEMGETGPGNLHFHVLFTLGAVLFIITFIINLIADLALHRKRG